MRRASSSAISPVPALSPLSALPPPLRYRDNVMTTGMDSPAAACQLNIRQMTGRQQITIADAC